MWLPFTCSSPFSAFSAVKAVAVSYPALEAVAVSCPALEAVVVEAVRLTATGPCPGCGWAVGARNSVWRWARAIGGGWPGE